jgi:hypothetical protein
VTFIVAFARPDFALLAADTRLTMKAAPGTPALGFQDDAIKLFPWETGWMVSGPMNSWARAIRAGVTRKAMGALKRTTPVWAQHVRDYQKTFIIGCNAAGPFRRCTDWRGRELVPGADPIAPRPWDAEATAWRQFLGLYAAEIKDQRLPVVLETTARLFHAIYRLCGPDGSVSPQVAVGVVYRSGRRQHFGPQPHGTFVTDAFRAEVVAGVPADVV